MAYKQKSFRFWVSYYDTAADMDDENRLAFYDAIVEYVFKNRDKERTLKKKGLRDAYIGFKSLKTNLKTSILRSEAGQKGNDARWSKTPDGTDVLRYGCDSFAIVANESQIKSKTQIKNKSKTHMANDRTPAACPTCGGVLSPTGAHRGDSVMYRCEACREEVWCDG